jgi:signal peptidase
MTRRVHPGRDGCPPAARRAPVLRRHGATALLLLCLAVLAGTVVVSRTESRLVTVQSGSMAPAVPVGAVLVERYEPVAELQAGDVITFRAPTPAAELVTHRVVSVDRADGRTVVRTRGDANPGEDPWQAELLGDRVWVVTATVPALGRPLDALRSPVVLAVTSLVLPAVFAVSTLHLIWRRTGPTRPRGRSARRAAARTGVLLVVPVAAAAVLATPTPAAAAFTARAAAVHAAATASLQAPSSVTLQDACPVTGTAADVSWTATGTTQTGYRIERRTDPTLTWTALATVPATARTYRDSTVVTLVQYTYRVSSVRGSWSSAPRTSAALTLTGTCSR